MANEISTMIKTTCTNPTSSATAAIIKQAFDLGMFQVTQTTAAVFANIVTVTTSEADIVLPTDSKFTAALQGLFCAINLDTTNFVKIGPKNAGNVMQDYGRLYPKLPVQMPIAPSVVQRWVADTASCNVMFVWFAK